MKKRLIVPMSLALLALAMFGGVASAAQPAEQGCLGETVSHHAKAGGSAWGKSISYDARTDTYWGDTPGLGDEVQWVLGGNPSPLPNSCSAYNPLP